MRYLIIGLGIYGSNLAIDLTRMGNEVIGADINPSLVESIKDYISTAYIVDSTDETALNMLPLKNVDVVIVAIGENFGASIRTVALLKKMGIKHIYARAIDTIHESILESFDLDRIVTPEQRAASDLVNETELGTDVASVKIAEDAFVMTFAAPDILLTERYSELEIDKKYGLKLLAASRQLRKRNAIGTLRTEQTLLDLSDTELTVEQGDRLCCLGAAKAYRSLFRAING